MAGKRIAVLVCVLALGGCGGGDDGGISVEEAREKGLLRDDAVLVTGPDEADAGGVELNLVVPAASQVELQLSGDCRSALEGPAVRAVTAETRVRVEASPRDGSDECVLVVDALVPGRPETGDGHAVTVRR